MSSTSLEYPSIDSIKQLYQSYDSMRDALGRAAIANALLSVSEHDRDTLRRKIAEKPDKMAEILGFIEVKDGVSVPTEFIGADGAQLVYVTDYADRSSVETPSRNVGPAMGLVSVSLFRSGLPFTSTTKPHDLSETLFAPNRYEVILSSDMPPTLLQCEVVGDDVLSMKPVSEMVQRYGQLCMLQAGEVADLGLLFQEFGARAKEGVLQVGTGDDNIAALLHEY